MKKFREPRIGFRTLVVAVFAFLFGCLITINLTPVNKTCRIDDTDREYNIMKNSKLKNPELIILIFSAPKNLDKRYAIRRSWLKLVDHEDEPVENTTKYRFKHYFVIGSLDLNSDQLLHLSAEQSQYNDILILPMHDSYKNLTEKVKKSFEWLTGQYNYGLDFKYVLKCDDDSFVNIPQLIREIPKMEITLQKSNLQYALNLPPEKLNSFITTNVQRNNAHAKPSDLSFYWGYFAGNAKIKSMGKYKESEYIACDRYVSYALGGGYILSKDLVFYIGKNVDYLRSYNSEDTSVGLWLAGVTNIIRIHDIRFDTQWTTRGCRNYYLVTHKISTEDMNNIYENVLSNKQLCVREVEKRSFYMYDWSQPPSQCCLNERDTI